MATLFFCVFPHASQTALGDPIQENVITIGAGNNEGAAIDGTKRIRRKVRVFPDADCFVTWGESPVATSDGLSGRPMAADVEEYFDIEAGHQISVIERV